MILRKLTKYLQHMRDDPILNNANSISESSCEGVHGSDVSDEQVLQVCGPPAHFSIKVQASWLQATLFNDGLEEIRHLRITRFMYHCSDLYSTCAVQWEMLLFQNLLTYYYLDCVNLESECAMDIYLSIKAALTQQFYMNNESNDYVYCEMGPS